MAIKKGVLISPTEAARMLSVSRQTVYNWIEEGKLPAVELSPRCVRIPARALEKLVVAHTKGRGKMDKLTIPKPKKENIAYFEQKLKEFEKKYHMSSTEFYEKWANDEIEDTLETNRWAKLYSFYLDVKKSKHKKRSVSA